MRCLFEPHFVWWNRVSHLLNTNARQPGSRKRALPAQQKAGPMVLFSFSRGASDSIVVILCLREKHNNTCLRENTTHHRGLTYSFRRERKRARQRKIVPRTDREYVLFELTATQPCPSFTDELLAVFQSSRTTYISSY